MSKEIGVSRSAARTAWAPRPTQNVSVIPHSAAIRRIVESCIPSPSCVVSRATIGPYIPSIVRRYSGKERQSGRRWRARENRLGKRCYRDSRLIDGHGHGEGIRQGLEPFDDAVLEHRTGKMRID